MRNFSSHHFALRARLLRRPTRCHNRYLRGSIAFLLRIPSSEELTGSDAKFQTLKALETVPPKLKRPHRPLWMSPAYIGLIDKRSALRQKPCHSQNLARGITRAVRQSLMSDSQRPVEEAETEIGAYLEPATVGAEPRGE